MTTASRSLRRASTRPTDADDAVRRPGSGRRIVGWILVLVAFVAVWEGGKWLGGDPWRIHASISGLAIDYDHLPPFHWRIADDLSVPYPWDVARAFVDLAQRNGAPLGLVLAGEAAFTLGEAVFGFAWGSLLGLGGAIINSNEYYVAAPERLWATIVMTTLIGLVFVGLVVLAERRFTRSRSRQVANS